MKRVTRLFFIIVLGFALGTAASAQSTPLHRFTFNIGGGVTPLAGQIGNYLNNGWNFAAGAGYRVNTPFSLGVQFQYNGLGVSRAVLNAAAVPSGDAHVWSLTLQPMVRLAPERKFDPYVVGGVGYYRRVVNFTQPTLARVTLFDPFFGLIFPGVVPANQVIGSVLRDGIGGNVGGGVSFGLGPSGMSVFAEARYHYADAGSARPTRMVPVTFGLRW